MQHFNDHKSGQLWDPFGFLGEKRRKLLNEDWPGVFRTFLLDELPVAELAAAFDKRLGRPSKELYTILGTLILQQMLDLTDEETIRAVAFDIQWHFALDIVGESDQEKYVSERTLRNYRRKVMELRLEPVLFSQLTDRLVSAFGVSTERQRLDSTHICSNMRALRRLELFVTVIAGFLRNVKRHHRALYEERVDEELAARYGKAAMKDYFGRVKPQQARPQVASVAEDLLTLVEAFAGDETIRRMHSYQAMERVLSEQCDVSRDNDGGEPPRVTVKEAKEVPSDCLQNPSDPDAAYDAHKGVGYQVQLAETYQPTKEGEKKDKTKPDLITYVAVEPANRSDAKALTPMLEDTKQRDCAPRELLADTSYGSDENVEGARKENVAVIAPAPGTGSKAGQLTRVHFHLEPTRCRCPAGHWAESVEVNAKQDYVARFERGLCAACPHQANCPIRLKAACAELTYTPKAARLSARRRAEAEEDFIDRYRWRAGIEGSASRYKSETGAGRLRVRGMAAVCFAATLKALGLNILRSGRARRAILRLKQPVTPHSVAFPALRPVIQLVRFINTRLRDMKWNADARLLLNAA